ncbi:bifunctional DedA family/phosphatase PAP2 family protein [Luteimonas sp. MJ250]|uniref:bifunctional DedA family/phosphatase PAP2 family protein n=1 Tax=Luteimonas sp. MJ250 TaxID=3129236 RepID=UPI0031BA94CF
MVSAWFDSLVTWIGAHPVAAGVAIFLIAFCDAVIILGAVVPALPLLFAIGVLIGFGEISGPYAIACAALGALAGDASSYWIGYRWGPQLRATWPFRKYPQLLDRAGVLFRRNEIKGIFIARYVGPVRPFVPAIAGMSRMPLRRYVPASIVAAISWAVLFLGPGWLLGEAYDAVAAVADRLALVVAALLAAIALAWSLVLYTYRWFANHADALLARALRWTRDHPRLGRYAAALISPNRPESASLVLLAVCLLAIGVAWFTLLATMLARGEPLALDLRIHDAMYALRNPLADRLMAGLASIGDPVVLGLPIALSTLWLLWRRRWMAAAHWLAALAFGLVLTAALEAAIDMPRPPTALSGFGFPSVGLTMTTITFGFFAVLIARELPGRQRVWPYLVSGAVVAVLGFARLYLGAHWLTDLVGGMLLGVAWLLALGIAYRRHVARSFWMRPLAGLFYGAFLLAALWHAPRAVDPLLERFAPQPAPANIDLDSWWRDGWAALPSQRNERDASRRWPLDVQVAGPLKPLETHLGQRGWTIQAQADWSDTLLLLDDDTPALEQKVLPATLGASAETLLARRTLDDGRILVLRLWHAPRQPRDGTPLWIGTVQTLSHARPFDLFGLWSPDADTSSAYALLRKDLAGSDLREDPHPASGEQVLRLRLPPVAGARP